MKIVVLPIILVETTEIYPSFRFVDEQSSKEQNLFETKISLSCPDLT